MNQKLKLVLLFDIDGTLIKTGSAGKYAMEAAFTELFKIKDGMEGISFAGSTDLGIYDSALRKNSIKPNEAVPEAVFRKKYLELLERYLKEIPNGQEILPGVSEFLNYLKTQNDVYVSLVTGNYREGARIKLNHFGIHHHFNGGAFGCDFANRNLLPPLALKRIENEGYVLPSNQRIWIIGDTIKDIECAKTNNLPSLITFTGFSPREDIQQLKPEMTLENLEDYQAFLDFALNY